MSANNAGMMATSSQIASFVIAAHLVAALPAPALHERHSLVEGLGVDLFADSAFADADGEEPEEIEDSEEVNAALKSLALQFNGPAGLVVRSLDVEVEDDLSSAWPVEYGLWSPEAQPASAAEGRRTIVSASWLRHDLPVAIWSALHDGALGVILAPTATRGCAWPNDASTMARIKAVHMLRRNSSLAGLLSWKSFSALDLEHFMTLMDTSECENRSSSLHAHVERQLRVLRATCGLQPMCRTAACIKESSASVRTLTEEHMQGSLAMLLAHGQTVAKPLEDRAELFSRALWDGLGHLPCSHDCFGLACPACPLKDYVWQALGQCCSRDWEYAAAAQRAFATRSSTRGARDSNTSMCQRAAAVGHNEVEVQYDWNDVAAVFYPSFALPDDFDEPTLEIPARRADGSVPEAQPRRAEQTRAERASTLRRKCRRARVVADRLTVRKLDRDKRIPVLQLNLPYPSTRAYVWKGGQTVDSDFRGDSMGVPLSLPVC